MLFYDYWCLIGRFILFILCMINFGHAVLRVYNVCYKRNVNNYVGLFSPFRCILEPRSFDYDQVTRIAAVRRLCLYQTFTVTGTM